MIGWNGKANSKSRQHIDGIGTIDDDDGSQRILVNVFGIALLFTHTFKNNFHATINYRYLININKKY